MATLQRIGLGILPTSAAARSVIERSNTGNAETVWQLEQGSKRRSLLRGGGCRIQVGLGLDNGMGKQFLNHGLVLGVGVPGRVMEVRNVVNWSTALKQGVNFKEGRTIRPKTKPGPGKPLCALTKEKPQASTEEPANLEKEAHKYFDQVVITVRAGDGGHGAVLDMPVPPEAPKYKPTSKSEQQNRNNEKGKRKTGFLKRGSDGSFQLPMGGHGADVILVADETVDSLLEFHKKRRFNAKRGGNVNAAGFLTAAVQEGLSAPTLLISVPVGALRSCLSPHSTQLFNFGDKKC
jgi:hypothetical protein